MQEQKVNWEAIKKKFPINSLIKGVVKMQTPFGIFLDIGNDDVRGIVLVVDFFDEPNEKGFDYSSMPALFSTVKGVVIGYFDDERNQIALSLKPSVVFNAKKICNDKA